VRVVLLSFDFPEYSVRLASGLVEQAETFLLAPREPTRPHLAKLDRRVRFEPFDRPRLRQAHRQLPLVWRLIRRIRAIDPDVVHLQGYQLWLNPLLPLLGRFPLVVTAHDPRHHLGDHEAHKIPQWLVHAGYRRADELIVHAPQMKAALIEACGVEPGRVHVVPHVVLGPEGGLPAEESSERPEVLFFGRVWEYKGLEYLIRAEPLIAAEVPEARVVIAGRGEDFGRYRALMTDPARFVVRNDFVSDAEAHELFRRSSVVVLPYVEATQSGVIPLAYSHGKPVVATTVGGLPAMVDDGETGLLVAPRDERALAGAIVRLLRDATLRQRLGANGRRKAWSEWSPARVGAQTRRVYQQALQSCAARVAPAASAERSHAD
jgi:glycosyltransferase involved in cell wall biosynthesis